MMELPSIIAPMSRDKLARKASPPKERHRLKIHALDPVIRPLDSVLPSPRARVTSISIASPEKTTTALPARPHGVSLRAGIACRGRGPGRPTLESVAFDPFSDSQSFSELLKDPEASVTRRSDPKGVSEFRNWLLQDFPQLVRTFRALRLIKAQPKRLLEDVQTSCVLAPDTTNQCDSQRSQEDEDEGDSTEEESEDDCEEPWRLIFRHATVVSAEPGDIIATQGVTQTGSVYFLLNGHCDLSFRPALLRDSKVQSSCSILPAAFAAVNESADRTTIHLRELAAGDFFGLDAAAFGFQYLLGSVTARIARQRNVLGLREAAYIYLFCLPFPVIQQLQRRYRDDCNRVPPIFPYSFAPEAETFLRNTFLFRGMADSSRHFLAAHLRPVVVARSEYLFTPGQPVRVFFIITGQLTLGTLREERVGVREEAELELELLQAHDSVGLMEATILTTTFERYCVVTSASGARAYVLSSTVLLMALAQEPLALRLIHEWVAQRKSWFELRRATALARRKKLATEDSEQVVRLTLASQRRSKLSCSRCGWSGHVSTSASCVCAETHAKTARASSIPMLDKSEKGPQEPKRATTLSYCPTSPYSVVPVHQPIPSPRMHAHRRLQIGSMALRALQIPKLSTVKPLLSSTMIVSGQEREEAEHPDLPESVKEHVVRGCTLSQSLQRLEEALGQKETPPVQQGRR